MRDTYHYVVRLVHPRDDVHVVREGHHEEVLLLALAGRLPLEGDGGGVARGVGANAAANGDGVWFKENEKGN